VKILFLLTQDLESPAGVGRYFPWARELARLGHQVSIAATHANYAGLQEKRFVTQGVEVNYVAQMHVRKQANLKTYFPPHQLMGIAMNATYELLKVAFNSKADIIQVGKPHPMNGFAGLAVKYLKNKLLFLDCDDFEMANIHFGASWQKLGVHFFETNLPKHADYVSVHTKFLQEQVQKLGVKPERIIYLPHGADHARFAHPDPRRVEALRSELNLAWKQVICFIGSLSLPSHPVDILLEAFQQVHTVLPRTILLIVGGGEEYDRLVAKARWLGLEEAIHFRGRVPGAEVPLYYQLADAAAEPVIDNTVGRSSLPLKMFESWVAGVPFITQEVGDRRRMLGDPLAGLLAAAGDANSLADALIKVLSDSELAAQLRERGFEQARKYSWENLSSQMETEYLKALVDKHGESS
jgi:glycosyltransferase involved in cell wall biosynthesis